MQLALAELGGLDVLVNNAALTIRRPFFEIDDAEWDDVLAVNLRGALIGCQLAGAHMQEHGCGRIVNLTSLAGQQGSAGKRRPLRRLEGGPARADEDRRA